MPRPASSGGGKNAADSDVTPHTSVAIPDASDSNTEQVDDGQSPNEGESAIDTFGLRRANFPANSPISASRLTSAISRFQASVENNAQSERRTEGDSINSSRLRNGSGALFIPGPNYRAGGHPLSSQQVESDEDVPQEAEPTFYAVEATLVPDEIFAVAIAIQQSSAPVYDAVLVPSRAKYKRCIFTVMAVTFVVIGVTVGAIFASKNSKQANSDSSKKVTQVGGRLTPTASSTSLPTASPFSPPTISCDATAEFEGYLFETSCGTCDPIVKIDGQTLMTSRNQENIQFGSYTGSQIQTLATFDIDYDVSDIAIFRNLAVVGATSVDNDSGGAFIFEKGFSGQWDQPVPIRPINITMGALFGYSVDIGKNEDYFIEVDNESKLQSGDHILAVGTPNDGEGSVGSVFIFRRNNTTWEQDTILRPPDSNSTAFGSAVSVNGDIIVVGDPYHRNDIGSGAVFVYLFNSFSNEWTQANTPIINDDCDGEFGASILLTVASGLLIGCPKDDNSTGAVYYYVQSDTDGEFIFRQKVVASDGVYGNNFGGVGSIAVDGKLMVVGTNGTLGVGGVYIFAQVNTSWTELASIDVPEGSELFGRRAALFENNIIVSSISNANSYSYSISQCLGIRERIEVQVLQRGAIFDGMNVNDPRYRALDWILGGDKLQLEGNADKLHQRYILALIAFSLDSPAWERCVRVYDDWNYIMTDDFCLVEGLDEDAMSADYSSWLSDTDECDWYGVSCTAGIVHRLDLNSSTLIGEIPPEISELQYVQFISLGRNCLYGTIPSEIGKLTSLQSLDLSLNGLSGYIPDDISELSSLVKLDVGYQADNYWDCTRSDGTFFYMDSGGLEGQILGSESIKKLRYLKEISISRNSFSGEISSEIGNLKQLVVLDAEENSFIGSIPEEITKLENLRELDFTSNFLSGELPSNIGNMKSLATIEVYNNAMTGTIPESLYNLTELTKLRLGSNHFSGTISKEIGDLKKLDTLFLDNNFFSGTLPTELGLCKELQLLWIGGSNINGTIPESLYNLTELTRLYLSFNQFSGTISKEIGNLKKLEDLDLYDNLFSGTIPTELGLCKELRQGLWLSNNLFSGTLPTELGLFKELQLLNLSYNNMTGTIPESLYNLTELTNLRLDDNQLSGTISKEIGNLKKLTDLLLRYNLFSGTLPTELGLCKELGSLWIDGTNINGSVPEEVCDVQQVNSGYIRAVCGTDSETLVPFISCGCCGYCEVHTPRL